MKFSEAIMPNYKITRDGELHQTFEGWDEALAEYARLKRLGEDPTLWMSQWCMVDVPTGMLPRILQEAGVANVRDDGEASQ